MTGLAGIGQVAVAALPYATQTSSFAWNFEETSTQPPHRAPERRAAGIMPKEDGAEAVFTFNPLFTAWQVALQEVQPPARGSVVPAQRAAGTMRGDDGDYARLITFFAVDLSEQPPQPPHRFVERRGAIIPKADGIEHQFSFVPPAFEWGGEGIEPAWQPPAHRWRIAGGTMRGDDGAEQVLIHWIPLRSLDLPPDLLHRWRHAPEMGDSGIEAPIPIPYVGWEAVLPNPVQRFAFKGGFIPPEFPVLFFPLISAAEWAFDAAELIRPKRKISAVEAEPSFWPLPRFVPQGYDHQESPMLRRRAMTQSIDEPLIPVLPPLRWGFERWDDARRARRFLLPMADEPLVLTPRPLLPGFEPALPGLRQRQKQPLDRGYELVTHFPTVWNDGWEVQSPQPPRPHQWRFGADVRGIDGTDFPFIFPIFDGWESLLFWPPHPRPERSGAVALGDLSGAWGPFVYLVPSGTVVSDFALYSAIAYDIGIAP